MTDYGLFVRDKSGRLQAAIEDFHDLELTLRFNAVGGWRLTLPTKSIAGKALTFGGGIVVLRDGVTVLSGDVRGIDREWTSERDQLICDGPDDLSLLADEIVSPDPSRAGPPTEPYTTQVADVYPLSGTARAESVIKHYVDYNIGPHAIPARRRYGLTMANDRARGNFVTGRGRFQPLIDLSTELATAGGLGLKLAQVDIGTGFARQFDVYESVNRAETAVFSPDLGTLSGFRYTLRASEANHFVVGGGGEGTARTILERGDAVAIARYGRIAQFIDRRDTTVLTELDQAISENITSKAQKVELRMTPLDTPSLRFGTDYALGDTVAVIMDGELVSDVVRTVVIQLTVDRIETVTPYVGTAALADKLVLQMFRALKDQNTRLRNLERR